MAKYTINTLLCLEKSLKSRLAQLKELASECTKKTHWLDTQRVEEPTYDIKKVDQKIVKLTKALFQIDMKVKETNARTEVNLEDFDFDDLTAAID